MGVVVVVAAGMVVAGTVVAWFGSLAYAEVRTGMSCFLAMIRP